MATTNRIKINKEIYIWAIKESRKDFKEIINRFVNFESWISHEILPTFRQVEELANFLKVPLGYMFLDEPPKTDIIESEFKTIGNKIPEISKELKDTLFNVGRKRDWLSDYRREKGWERLIPEDLLNFEKKDIYSICIMAKEHLDIDEFWYKGYSDTRAAFNYLREKLESSGITVMQSGVVGSDNNRALNIDEFRGFLLYDDVAPIIFINSNDSVKRKIFTLIHEYIHFLGQKNDIFIEEDMVSENENEQFIHRITAEFLIPKDHMEEAWDYNVEFNKQIQDLRKRFHVSKVLLAIKLKEMNIINQEAVNEVNKHSETLGAKNIKSTEGGGDYYKTTRSRFGNSFLRTVIQSSDSGDISYTDAFKLLDNSVKAYDYFKEEYKQKLQVKSKILINMIE